MEDIESASRYHLDQLFGKDVFYETLEHVVSAYRQQTGPQTE